MDVPPTSGTSWIARMIRAFASWTRRGRRAIPIRSLALSPPCSLCGIPSANVVLSEYADDWRLAFQGIGGGNLPGGDLISEEKAQAIQHALSLPYELAKIQSAGFCDDFGYCTDCEKFYCAIHWQASVSGGGVCPAGHFKSLDPHWHPDWDDL